MAGKNSVEVVINGKIYQLAGSESEGYMHEVASYLNQKILDFQKETWATTSSTTASRPFSSR